VSLTSLTLYVHIVFLNFGFFFSYSFSIAHRSAFSVHLYCMYCTYMHTTLIARTLQVKRQDQDRKSNDRDTTCQWAKKKKQKKKRKRKRKRRKTASDIERIINKPMGKGGVAICFVFWSLGVTLSCFFPSSLSGFGSSAFKLMNEIGISYVLALFFSPSSVCYAWGVDSYLYYYYYPHFKSFGDLYFSLL